MHHFILRGLPLTSCMNQKYLFDSIFHFLSHIIAHDQNYLIIPHPISKNNTFAYNHSSEIRIQANWSTYFRFLYLNDNVQLIARRTNKRKLLHARGQFPLNSSSPRTASLASGSTTKCRHFEMGTATHTKPANTTRFCTNPWTL